MKEIGRNILKKAIKELPKFACNDVPIWEIICKKLEAENSIKMNVNLPEFNAPEGIWETIETNLNKITYEKAIKNLPEYSIPTDIWPGIEKQLVIGNNRKLKTVYYTLLKVAAIFVILAGSTLLFKAIINYRSNAGTLTYSIEIIDDSEQLNPNDFFQINSDEPIQKICLNNPEICETPLFLDLNKQIEDVNSELEKISKILQTGSDPQMLRYYFQLENEKVEIEKKMIQIINQS